MRVELEAHLQNKLSVWPWENHSHAQNGCFLSSENEGVGLDDLYSFALQASLI